MSPSQPLLPDFPPHRNQQLFSDHYLDALLPQRGDWQMLAGEAGHVRARLAAIFAAYTPSKIEAQTEHELVRPVLAALGHTFEVQASLATPRGTKTPDYVFYRDAAACLANKGKLLNEALLAPGAVAVGEAKYWDRPLDVALRTAGDDAFANPASQIAFYVQQSGAAWGILTNGRLWRLYHRDTAHKLDRFYEVDVPALLASGDPSALLYFYGFFRRGAFDDGPLGLATLLQESRDYAHGVGDTLKAQVYEALRHLAQGFLDYAPNGLNADAATRKAIYDHALILLYRLLFVFYAEARELLPLRASDLYRDHYSLYAITRGVERDLRTGRRLLAGSATLWPRLRELFGIINTGSPPLRVATFNGGLFDPARYPFLEQRTVGDGHLQEAIERLARVNGEFIDYRDLAERHLGTIYEGLLEYHLEAIGPSPSPPPISGEGAGWTIDLFNDKGERRATGSYYTPDYVVKYIVEQAVGPALREATATARDDAAKVKAVLDINVLDPAMGSGHFLVEATEYIARFLVELGLTPDERRKPDNRPSAIGNLPSSDLAAWKRRVAQSCIYGVDLNPLAVDLAKLSLWLITAAQDRPLSFLDHHLRTGNALVGARLADLTVGAPLAGTLLPIKRAARKSQQAEAAGQMSMLADDAFRRSLSSAVDFMWLIEASKAETVAEVKQQEQLYAQLCDDLTRKYSRLAALATATRFGVTVDPALWRPLTEYAAGRSLATFPKFDAWLAEADVLAGQHRFFHWELEFPEVFFDRHGQSLGERAGFDVVIGNPPYVRQETLGPLKPFFAVQFAEVYHGTADLFVYFFAQGMRQLRQGGRLAYISSDSWLRANYARALRAYLRTQATVETLVDIGDNRVFADAADVYPAIPVVRKAPPPADYTAQAAVFTRGEGVKQFAGQVAAKLMPVSIHDQPDSGWQLGDDAGRRLFARLMAAGRPLREVVEGRIYRGILTGLNEAFIVDQATCAQFIEDNPATAELIKPILRGEDLRPWYQEADGRWVIVMPSGWTRDRFGAGLSENDAWRRLRDIYPRLTAHLTDYADLGRRRQDQGEYWWELRSCDYYREFDQIKILWPDISKFPRFSWDTSGMFVGNTGYIAVTQAPWVLGYLGSRCAWFLISKTSIGFGERAGQPRFRLIDQYLRPLSIPDAPAADRDAIAGLAMEITDLAVARYDLHRKAQHRILADLGVPDRPLNQKLTAWWALDFPAFRGELQKTFRRDVPLKERDDWEAWLAGRRNQHEQLTAEIVRLETALNARVYALFGLSAVEVKIIEAATRYRYGEV